ncbi:PREDICTED: uncharacterized protein LOC108969271 [Bactrocera latifrons]|uniref:Uncharacterized protein n=1 Tax=Bactrocera latifrons TaxID=174628 RepID=A0A0K8UQ75_BACLA|nr:PREDICTED: uncharacterized protein LOC108969271 [Bactrocera latifrons]
MQPRMQLLLLAVIAVITRQSKHANANVLFRFALDFHVKSDESNETDGAINKTLIFENNHITIKNNLQPEESIEEELTAGPDKTETPSTTAGPLRSMSDFWLQEQNVTDVAETVDALTQLNREISPLVGRSDYISSKVKLVTRYLNILDARAAAANDENLTNSQYKYDQLRKFIKLAEKLKEPPIAASERTLDYTVMKLALEKYHIADLQEKVAKQVTDAEKAWQLYVKTRLVEVDA